MAFHCIPDLLDEMLANDAVEQCEADTAFALEGKDDLYDDSWKEDDEQEE